MIMMLHEANYQLFFFLKSDGFKKPLFTTNFNNVFINGKIPFTHPWGKFQFWNMDRIVILGWLFWWTSMHFKTAFKQKQSNNAQKRSKRSTPRYVPIERQALVGSRDQSLSFYKMCSRWDILISFFEQQYS